MATAASLASTGLIRPLIAPCCSTLTPPGLLNSKLTMERFIAFAMTNVSNVPVATTPPAIIKTGCCNPRADRLDEIKQRSEIIPTQNQA